MQFSFEMSKNLPLVIDIGKAYTKCGYAANSAPSFIIKTQVEGIPVFNPIRNDPVVLYKNLVEFFKLISFKYMLSNLRDSVVIIVESLMNSTIIRETLAKVLFCHYEIGSLIYLPQHVVSLMPLVINTALIVDCGYSSIIITPICDGVTVLRAVNELPYGSETVHQNLKQILCKDNANLIDSISESVIENIKVRCCFVTKKYRADCLMDDNIDKKRDFELCHSVKYLVKDGKMLTVSGMARETAFENIFQENDGQSLAINILEAISKSPIDYRNKLMENILLIGGTCMAKGFVKRLQEELFCYVKLNDIYIERKKLEMPIKTTFKFFRNLPGKENYIAWLGGAIYGTTGIIRNNATTRNDYLKNQKIRNFTNTYYLEDSMDHSPYDD